MKPALRIIKLGGNLIDSPNMLNNILSVFASVEGAKILVHGGGKKATALSKQLGYTPRMINGRRVTSAEELEVVTMVYAGLLNKNIVALLQSKNCNAIGLSGADANLMLAQKRPPEPIDYGWVGDVSRVDGAFLQSLVNLSLTPVCCALSHDGKGNMLNTNADTVAQEIATALCDMYEVELVFCFEKKGVLLDIEDAASVVPVIDPPKYAELREKGLIHSGMIPKLDNAFDALARGVSRVILGDIDAIAGKSGTLVVNT